jgi:phosphoribosylanthranilate isomerase
MINNHPIAQSLNHPMVKICGLTNIDDALAAIDAGATHLGFNFYPPSPRYLPPGKCAEIISALGIEHWALVTVGVFVNESPARVAAILDDCGLDFAQLHGDETPEMLAQLHGRAFKAFRGMGDNHAEYAKRSPSSQPSPSGRGSLDEGRGPAFLVDAHSPALYGGTGRTADWSAAQTLAATYPIFLAGGLTPDNVAQAIAQVKPWGVDVASGVESSPGKKDHAKLQAFIQNAVDL